MAENVNKPGSGNSNLGKGGNSGNSGNSGNQNKGNQSGSNIDRGQSKDEDLKKKTSGKDLKGNRLDEDQDLDSKEGRDDLGSSDKRNFDQNKGNINKGR